MELASHPSMLRIGKHLQTIGCYHKRGVATKKQIRRIARASHHHLHQRATEAAQIADSGSPKKSRRAAEVAATGRASEIAQVGTAALGIAGSGMAATPGIGKSGKHLAIGIAQSGKNLAIGIANSGNNSGGKNSGQSHNKSGQNLTLGVL